MKFAQPRDLPSEGLLTVAPVEWQIDDARRVEPPPSG